ncbi:MAG TPA: glycosyltransferase [Candidatus Omnitrophota bacterium]|nr:glycosyltransferase [Candidatus Omnitrophota bacterium]
MWCQKLCRFLAGQGHVVTVLTLNVYNEEEFWKDPPISNTLIRFGRVEYDGSVKIIRCKRNKIPRLIFAVFRILDRFANIYLYGPHSIEMCRSMISLIRKADIVHLHTLPYPHNLIGMALARLFRKKVVIVPHFHIGNRQYESLFNFWLMRGADKVCTVTEYERDFLIDKGIRADKIVLTYNSIDAAEYCPRDIETFRKDLCLRYSIDEDTRLIIFIGRKIEYKGIPDLVEAFKIIRAKIKVKLLLIGPDFAWFEKYFASLPAELARDIIDFGVVPHQVKVNLLSLSSVLVLPSRYEAFGIVFLEAWACNVPVIGCDINALPHIIGDAGFVFRAGDANDLSLKIKAVLSDARLSARMVQAGRRKVLHDYSYTTIGARILNAYYDLRGKRKKVMIVSNLFPPFFQGGAEISAYEQASAMKRAGHRIHVFCGKLDNARMRYRPVKEKGPFDITRIRLHASDFDSHRPCFDNPDILCLFRDTLRDFAPDVVHIHNLAGFPDGIVTEIKKLHIPVVMTVHDYWLICMKKTLLTDAGSVCGKYDPSCSHCMSATPLRDRNVRLKNTMSTVDFFICPSRHMADSLEKAGFSHDKIRVIPYGIQTARFKRSRAVLSNGKMFTFGYVGYLGPHKGVEILLRAFDLLRNKDRAVVDLVLCGYERTYLKQITDMCAGLGISRRVRFYSRLPNTRIDAAYSKINCFVLPSIWPENHPVSITEAMASGIPVIASDIGGTRELVEDRKTGLLFPCGDASKLAECMERFIENPGEAGRMGANGRRMIKGLELDTQVGRILETYAEITGLT